MASQLYKGKFTYAGNVGWSSVLAHDPLLRVYRQCEVRTIDAALQWATPPRGLRLLHQSRLEAFQSPSTSEPEDIWIVATHGHISTPVWADARVYF